MPPRAKARKPQTRTQRKAVTVPPDSGQSQVSKPDEIAEVVKAATEQAPIVGIVPIAGEPVYIPMPDSIPTVVSYLFSIAWASFKGVGPALQMKDVCDFDGYDYDMTVNGTIATVNMRVNANRKASRNMELTRLQGKLVTINNNIASIKQPLEHVKALQIQIEAAKTTRADLEWVHQQEENLIGWDKREKELNLELAKYESQIPEIEAEAKRLRDMDMSEKKTWEINLLEME